MAATVASPIAAKAPNRVRTWKKPVGVGSLRATPAGFCALSIIRVLMDLS